MRWVVMAALLAAPAWGNGPQWQYQVESTVAPGQKAALILKPRNDVFGVVVKLSSAAGSETFRAKKLEAGVSKRFAWRVPEGVSRWSGTLTGSAGGATTTAPIEFEVVSLKQLDVRIDKRDVDLAAGRVSVVPNRPLATAEVTAFAAGGGKVVDTKVDVVTEGDRAVVQFDVPDDLRLARVELKLADPYGQWVGLRIVSWYAEIAHEEVEFETAKWAVRPSEAPKVDRAIEALHKEVARFRAELGNDAATVEARVYVAGYTDTVGSHADNQALSRKRARAIAEYFRDHGVGLPIYYQGFGESALAVPTGDNVPEARNRRALYVLTNVPPSGSNFPGGAWKKL